jgi:hypothetical protein
MEETSPSRGSGDTTSILITDVMRGQSLYSQKGAMVLLFFEE